jgi:hypothetical protein
MATSSGINRLSNDSIQWTRHPRCHAPSLHVVSPKGQPS